MYFETIESSICGCLDKIKSCFVKMELIIVIYYLTKNNKKQKLVNFLNFEFLRKLYKFFFFNFLSCYLNKNKMMSEKSNFKFQVLDYTFNINLNMEMNNKLNIQSLKHIIFSYNFDDLLKNYKLYENNFNSYEKRMIFYMFGIYEKMIKYQRKYDYDYKKISYLFVIKAENECTINNKYFHLYLIDLIILYIHHSKIEICFNYFKNLIRKHFRDLRKITGDLCEISREISKYEYNYFNGK